MANHTLHNGLVTLNLPSGMHWIDEFDHVALKSKPTLTLDGGQILEQSIQTKGRPITLEAADDHGWITRATLIALQAMASAVTPLTFTHADGRIFSVAFADSKPLTARPIWPLSLPVDEDVYIVTLKLIEA